MLVCVWSPKGGSGTSVFAAACALAAAREPGYRESGAGSGETPRLADLRGDQPAILGLASEPSTGLREWLQVGPEAPTEALDRIAVDTGAGVRLLPAGRGALGTARAEAGAALGVALRAVPGPVVADAGVPDVPALEALVEVADASVVVVRGCYLALRRAVTIGATARAAGAVLVEEPGRALGAREVADVLGVPVLARVGVRATVARVVDAGVLTARVPDALLRPARAVLAAVGAIDRQGRAA